MSEQPFISVKVRLPNYLAGLREAVTDGRVEFSDIARAWPYSLQDLAADIVKSLGQDRAQELAERIISEAE